MSASATQSLQTIHLIRLLSRVFLIAVPIESLLKSYKTVWQKSGKKPAQIQNLENILCLELHTWVVLPQPVSPVKTTTRWFETASIKFCRSLHAGKDWRALLCSANSGDSALFRASNLIIAFSVPNCSFGIDMSLGLCEKNRGCKSTEACRSPVSSLTLSKWSLCSASSIIDSCSFRKLTISGCSFCCNHKSKRISPFQKPQ